MLHEIVGSSEAAGVRGVGVLRDPALNKGTAFTEVERDALNLRGLLPEDSPPRKKRESSTATSSPTTSG